MVREFPIRTITHSCKNPYLILLCPPTRVHAQTLVTCLKYFTNSMHGTSLAKVRPSGFRSFCTRLLTWLSLCHSWPISLWLWLHWWSIINRKWCGFHPLLSKATSMPITIFNHSLWILCNSLCNNLYSSSFRHSLKKYHNRFKLTVTQKWKRINRRTSSKDIRLLNETRN